MNGLTITLVYHQVDIAHYGRSVLMLLCIRCYFRTHPIFLDFEVTSLSTLPNVTAVVSRSFAGNIATNRPGHPNDTIFFWGFEKENGSLTSWPYHSNEPWLIWLNGGPGA